MLTLWLHVMALRPSVVFPIALERREDCICYIEGMAVTGGVVAYFNRTVFDFRLDLTVVGFELKANSFGLRGQRRRIQPLLRTLFFL